MEKCLALGHRFPEITGWVRANKEDLKKVKEMGLKETGILTSVSDYHIYMKLELDRRKKCLDMYLGVVKDALSMGIVPRCHFEDATRADVYGFVMPFALELAKLRQESDIPSKSKDLRHLGLRRHLHGGGPAQKRAQAGEGLDRGRRLPGQAFGMARAQ